MKFRMKYENCPPVYIRGALSVSEAIASGNNTRFYSLLLASTRYCSSMLKLLDFFLFLVGCAKLEIEAQGLKLFTEDGVLLFDEDMGDEALIDEKTIVLAKEPPSTKVPTVTSQGADKSKLVSTLEKQGSNDTLILDDSLSDLDSTPSSRGSPCSKLPTFSTILHNQLLKCGHNPCDPDTWKRVSKIFYMQSYKWMRKTIYIDIYPRLRIVKFASFLIYTGFVRSNWILL